MQDARNHEEGPSNWPGNERLRPNRRELLGGALVAGMTASGILAACDSGDSGQQTSPATGPPERGGTLRVGIRGQSTSAANETLNVATPNNETDRARLQCVYERLVTEAPNGGSENELAQEFETNADATEWTIRLRDDVTWHDGSPFVADDVVYSLRWILDEKNGAEGRSELEAVLAPSGIQRVDRSTLRLRLKSPNALLPRTLSSRTMYMIKDGTKSFKQPIGTGAWKFESWESGQRTVLTRNDQHRKHDGPYLDSVEFVHILDTSARVNALLSAEIDCAANIDATSVPAIEGQPNLRVMETPSGACTPLTMFVDTAPFRDNRVRQALRLIPDRQQLVENVLSGHGEVANDLFASSDPLYNSELPQREHDPEQAKSLLRQAGQENLTVALWASDVAPGMLESATLFAEQAKQADVTVNIKKVPADQFWSTAYLKRPFTLSEWSLRPLDTYIGAALSRSAPFNETHWKRPDFDKLWLDARSTVDEAGQKEKWFELQRVLWEEGGHVIWGFGSILDGHHERVRGLKPNPYRSLGWYDFTDVTLA